MAVALDTPTYVERPVEKTRKTDFGTVEKRGKPRFRAILFVESREAQLRNVGAD
jgi:hypothetical protein